MPASPLFLGGSMQLQPSKKYQQAPRLRSVITPDEQGACLRAMARTTDIADLFVVLKKCNHPKHAGLWVRLVIGLSRLP